MNAIKGMTIWAALANFEENEKGTMEIGKCADFVVLDNDILKEKEASILRAEAEKEVRIQEAQGKAEAIIEVQTATAKGIELVKKAGADEAVLRLEAYKAMVEVANGQATKLIIPSDMQGIVGLAASVFESVKK